MGCSKHSHSRFAALGSSTPTIVCAPVREFYWDEKTMSLDTAYE